LLFKLPREKLYSILHSVHKKIDTNWSQDDIVKKKIFREIRIVPIFLCLVFLECLTFVCWCQWSTFKQQVLFLSVYNGFTFIDLWWSFQGHCCLEWWILIPLVYVESLPQTFIMSAISNTNNGQYTEHNSTKTATWFQKELIQNYNINMIIYVLQGRQRTMSIYHAVIQYMYIVRKQSSG
jgi:hypothetical protein